MKNKLVLRVTTGTDESPLYALLAYEMRPAENRYEMWMFMEDSVDAEFIKKLSEEWRNGHALEFPAAHRHETHELTASGELLPADCRTDRPDIVTRAKTEWMFTVLSTKLFGAYQTEVQSLKERSEQLNSYSKELWEDLKNFWERVQEQLRFKSILREQADELKSEVNQMFDRLKKLRDEEDKIFEREAKAAYERMIGALADIEQRLQEGKSDLFRVFNELKQIQSEYHKAKLTRNLRNQLWERIDNAFKKAKGSRSSESAPVGGGDDRYGKRIAGLREVIAKMDESVRRDEKDLEDMQARIASGKASQLEVQLRETKVALVRERLQSKQEKLADMRKTYDDLVRKQEKSKAEAEKAKALAEAKAKIEAQKKAEAREKEELAREQMEKAMAIVEAEKKEAAASAEPAVDAAPAEVPVAEEAPVLAVADPEPAAAEEIQPEPVAEAATESTPAETADATEAPVSEISPEPSEAEEPTA